MIRIMLERIAVTRSSRSKTSRMDFYAWVVFDSASTFRYRAAAC